MRDIVIESGQSGQRLDKFLRRYLPAASGGFLYKMLRKKNILLNGSKASGSEHLSDGDVVRLYFSDAALDAFRGREDAHQYPDLPRAWILAEGAHLLVLNKPAGILSQGDGSGAVSLVDYLRGYLHEADHRLYRPGVANRLDRNTSGIVLAAKDSATAQQLMELLALGAIRKTYLALVCGSLENEMTLEGYLLKDEGRNLAQVTSSPRDGAKHIVTRITPVGHLTEPIACTLLSVELKTGRPHQIRAHLASVGHPIVGDVKYGREKVNRVFRTKYGLNRQFLHACEITFPKTEGLLSDQSEVRYRAAIPGDLARLYKEIKGLNYE